LRESLCVRACVRASERASEYAFSKNKNLPLRVLQFFSEFFYVQNASLCMYACMCAQVCVCQRPSACMYECMNDYMDACVYSVHACVYQACLHEIYMHSLRARSVNGSCACARMSVCSTFPSRSIIDGALCFPAAGACRGEASFCSLSCLNEYTSPPMDGLLQACSPSTPSASGVSACVSACASASACVCV